LRKLGREALAQEPALRNEIIQTEMDSWVIGIALERLHDQTKAGKASAASASILKLIGTELNKRRCELALTIGGVDGLDAQGAAAHDWLHAPANCIAGGSNEIQLNILSKRVLGLPGA